MRRPLFLTGLMGCGKTTVGRVLALAQGVPLVDLDIRLERSFGAAVPELLAAWGETAFREAEARVLASLLAEPAFAQRGVVVATGGGTVLHPGSREAIDHTGTRVYLEVGADELVRRLQPAVAADPGARPLLLQGASAGSEPADLRQRVAALLATRDAVYRTGALCIDAHGEPGVVAARITAAVPDLRSPHAHAPAAAPGPAPAVGGEAV